MNQGSSARSVTSVTASVKRAEPGAHAADHVGLLRDQPLRRVLGLLRGVAGIERDELELRPAQRLDAAGGVDLGDRGLGAHLHELALPCPRAGKRYDHPDLHRLRLLRDGALAHHERRLRQHGDCERGGKRAAS